MLDLEKMEKTAYRVALTFPNAQTLVLLWKVDKPQPVQFDTGKHQMPYFNFTSYDINHSYRELKAKGAKLSEIYEEDGYTFFKVFDLDGNPVDIVEETGQTLYFAHKNNFREQQ